MREHREFCFDANNPLGRRIGPLQRKV